MHWETYDDDNNSRFSISAWHGSGWVPLNKHKRLLRLTQGTRPFSSWFLHRNSKQYDKAASLLFDSAAVESVAVDAFRWGDQVIATDLVGLPPG